MFPPVNEGLRSLKTLYLNNYNLIDGGLPEDIGGLSSLKRLDLEGNKFEHLPRSIAQLGALQVLNLRGCSNLKEFRELPPALDELETDWENDSIYNSFAHALFQNISSKQHDISASDCLSQRVFTLRYARPSVKIPSWFQYKGWDKSISMPENWYSHDNFLGFAACYDDILVETTVHLGTLCEDGETSWMTQKFALHRHYNYKEFEMYQMSCRKWSPVTFFFVPLAGLWDTSKANGKTPNDYKHIQLYFSGESKMYGLRLLYRDELEGEKENDDEPAKHSIGIRSRYANNGETLQLFPANTGFESEDNDELGRESLLQMKENNEICIGIRRSRYENNGETLQLFPANTGFENEDNDELEPESLLQMKENNELCIGIRGADMRIMNSMVKPVAPILRNNGDILIFMGPLLLRICSME